MHFRHALIRDASSLAAISMEVWIGTYLRNGVNKFFADYALSEFTTAKFEAIIANDRENIIVSENDDGIDGFVRIAFDSPAPIPGCSATEIKTLYLQPRHHGRGIGKGLLNEGVNRCADRKADAVWLTVNAQNASAIRFYAAQKFETIGRTHFRIGDQTYPNEVMLRRIS
ncbi:GNAT family N-acetyltransferase [Agrobacterium sp. rho-13.3]|uniref:GNAT family N-acetyltransferase n=1 Tax=Agrobacterium sp. rho-13.3 TaxID=3072980 RepID=UPI002A103D67|nr:GNAT family N-acetyltransferase [Agrobacterium sp. rho-13.3]MDX8307847.1 GNAT family N-acetyltransferase [Agrobacterium sp. rho-13.3]